MEGIGWLIAVGSILFFVFALAKSVSVSDEQYERLWNKKLLERESLFHEGESKDK